ncbi:hypothetical protein FRB94_002570 [Tulasnella sp. JGI-2019a]|nr:hypothetical protein FRB94_002570 [Tulasnella sp. JGI-2019a]
MVETWGWLYLDSEAKFGARLGVVVVVMLRVDIAYSIRANYPTDKLTSYSHLHTTMSQPGEDEAELQPTFAPGYKLGDKKTAEELANLDQGDESLNEWKAKLGIKPGAPPPQGPKASILTLFLVSPSLEGRTIELDLTNKAAIDALKKNPVNIKEGVEYNVGMRFQVNHDIVSGLRYIHVVKRAGIKVDKMEQMVGSFGPSTDGKPHSVNFPTEESPSGMVARSGTYNVKSRVTDDDKEVHADFEWAFKLTKEW